MRTHQIPLCWNKSFQISFGTVTTSEAFMFNVTKCIYFHCDGSGRVETIIDCDIVDNLFSYDYLLY